MTESEDAGIIMTSVDNDLDSELMTDDEDPTDRYDAARWLRKRVGVVAARDLPAEPSEEDFRQGLRSGIILCNVLNKIRSGSVPKVVNAPSALFSTPDASAQAAYCENVKNFLVAMEELGLPTFEPSDLEPEGEFSNVVDSVLAMKAYSETGSSDFTWTPRPSRGRKTFLRRNSEPAMNAFSRTQSVDIDQLLGSMDQYGDGDDLDEECDSGPLYMIVCDLLEDREEDDIPIIVENILNKVKEEFQSRLGLTNEDDNEEESIQKSINENYSGGENNQPIKQQENSSIEDDRAAKERERIKREKELLALQEKAKKKEEDEKAAKEQERINREKELLALKEKAKKQEEDEKAAKEQERIDREKELLRLQEMAKKKEEDEKAAKEQERINREKELLEQKEKARKEEEERIKREKRELALKEKARKKEEARIKREKQILAQKAKAKKEEQERIRREKRELAKKEKARKREEERIRRDNLSLAQKEKAREEQERIKKEIELLALEEKAKEDEICAIESKRINREKELLEEEEKDRKEEEEEQEHIEREREKERARRKDEYRRRMNEYKKIQVNTPKQRELVGQQDKDLQELRSTISAAKTDVRSMQNNCQDEADSLGTHVETLCQAAAGYKKVLDENRKLYNQVQDLKGSIRVYCRVRPFLPGQENQVTSVDYIDDETVTIIVPSNSGREGRKASMFNKVFGPSATQEEVFSDTQPLIRSVLDGFNVCVFACGQTGAGKTYTLTGPEEPTPETMGVNYRALNDLFLISEERKNLMNYEISINMLEIYNDEIRDLLVTDGKICNPAKKGINVPDANLVPVSSTDEVMNLMNLCKKNRAADDHSSRAHSFLTAHVFGKDLTSGTTTRGCMHLVDLAGSEKLDTSDDEATHINTSLSALGDVLVALANKSSRVPYKACKLTQLLQDALGAQAKILMFVHVHPAIDKALETLSTFKFVERFSTLEGGAGKSSDVRELKEQICYLKSALAKKESGDPQWQELVSSPRSGEQNGAFEDDQTDEKTKKQSAKGASVKKAAAGAVAAVKLGKQQTTLDPKKKKGK
ncbi:hypothetical protein R6Q59_018507 [Mikania micrantha]